MMTETPPERSAAAPRFRRYSGETRAAMLVEAGLICLARGGITAFTVDNICREAGASRGLITHHFGSKDRLLAACYAAMYDRMSASFSAAEQETPGLAGLIEANFAPEVFNAESLRVWLALWGEIATSEALRSEHRARYQDYLFRMSRAISDAADARSTRVNAHELAVLFIALSDGLWLEHGIDPTMLSREAARAACFAFFEKSLGPLR
ncbi:TetR family transcriptional regulator C-terminal domain-containing protein [Pseudogemmobacter faecipullorum]|uniref:TetR family transcriptional regulator C-terminal domain-containing protein n=1 Tax=Pseudogemmobacter faecipullorum TaxID=2755041 RepID=A0ABS8CRI6_9RHOB|nr:TetR family transcriptional regulator C-terminal domain-containing protein [Pseudogemmobacter faecipullorum]MCB5412011.1 TetR family transcriptional regulator C-terminal domain-containing protein [Pseudogemmobacter faecipullorum]